jgi:Aminoglycoside-2''-adenylyltransferase
VSGSGRDAPASEAFDPDLAEWRPWRPHEAARLLAGVEAPWYVAAGWAIDLFLGAERRKHDDLEIGVPADRFGDFVTALARFELYVVGPDPAAPPGRDLATPVAQAEELLARYHQTWVLEREPCVWRLDVFREPSDGDCWICRRDERIRLPYEQLIEETNDGIPYARPEVVLLFKAKAARAKDNDDLAAVLPNLEPERRRWLVEALELVHPDHPWLARLVG